MVKKICFAASSGGHLEEISKLKEIRDKYESFLITEKSVFTQLNFCEHVYYLKQLNRKELLFIFKFVHASAISLGILMREKPDAIISTGALSTFPVCLFGKLMGKRIVYIESFARVDSPSLTGKIMYRFHIADLFIVQWEEMLEFFPNAQFGGGIF